MTRSSRDMLPRTWQSARSLLFDRDIALWWTAYVAGFAGFNALRSIANDTGLPVRTAYPIELDRLLFAGTDPVVWLQTRFFSGPDVGLVALLAVLVHSSFFVAPHAVAIVAWLWRRDLFGRYVLLYLAVNYVGLLIYFLVPTTPPWLAAQAGYLEGIERIVFQFGHIEVGTDPNPVAAMPSLHMAVTVLIYLWHRRVMPRLAVASLVYCGVMGVALVFLAEHYVTDLVAGVMVALAVDRTVARWTGARRDGGAAEPGATRGDASPVSAQRAPGAGEDPAAVPQSPLSGSEPER